jgi:cell division protein FtsZ
LKTAFVSKCNSLLTSENQKFTDLPTSKSSIKMSDLLNFNLPKHEENAIIKVVGVGGGGSNAVNYMYNKGINGVDFVVCNTDAQALDNSPILNKMQLGHTLTKGRGAGARPEVGRDAAMESIEEIRALFHSDLQMVFVTAGMGGGTGTGAAPVIAQVAKEMGILTVGIVTVPFAFENKKRTAQATAGIEEMRKAVDTLLIIRNDKLRELYGNLSLSNAFSHADDVLCTAAKSIAELITITGIVNVDMNDVITVMRGSGVAIMGSGRAQGEDQAIRAVQMAMESPLLNDDDITGASHILLNITYGNNELKMDEIGEITDFIQDLAGPEADIIWGYGKDEQLGEDICVNVIATGFAAKEIATLLPLNAVKEAPAPTPVFVLGDAPTVAVVEPSPVVEENPVFTLDTTPVVEEAPAAMPVAVVVEETPVVAETAPLTEMPVAEVTEEPFKLVVADEIELEIENSFESNPTVEEPIKQGALFSFEEFEKAELANAEMMKMEVEEPEIPELSTFKIQENNTAETPVIPSFESIRQTSDREIPETQMTFKPEVVAENRPPRTELMARNKEREARIREYTMRMKSPNGLNELENEPAYLRRKVTLDEGTHSSENTVSRTISREVTDENGNTRIELRSNNPYLHDNVD